MTPEAVLFDLDDTIVAFEAVADLAWSRVCQTFVKKTGLVSETELLNTINATREWYWSDPDRHRIGRMDLARARRGLIKMALEKLGCNNESYAIEIADRYSKLRTELIYVIPGTQETLERLCNRGIPLALITNGTVREQRAKIERFDLSKYFQVILIEEQVGFG